MTSESASNKLCITLDVDWAPEEVLRPVITQMEKHRVKATFFATHASAVLMDVDENHFEVGLHPNFNDAKGDLRQPVETLKHAYPKAVGGRSHSLAVSSHILQSYRQFGLKYESNIFLDGHEGLHPVHRFDGFLSIPFCWSDDKHLEMRRPFEMTELKLESAGLKVLNFHPIHVFMNTSSDDHYASYKQYYQQPDQLKNLINRDAPGIGTLFEELLQYLEKQNCTTHKLYEIFQAHAG